MKTLSFIQRNNQGHWVGDGFPVRSIFSYAELAEELSPFLLLDYAGPTNFPESPHRRGVGEHPHRGFETVTIVYDGEVEHRDSSGGGGIIRAGDVQWMTAASGVVHEEFHSEAYTRSGGPFEVIQLWVNLPKEFKMSQPRYQALTEARFPVVRLPNDAGSIRVIAGGFGDARGPAQTFTPINLWDVSLSAGRSAEFRLPAEHTTALFVRRGHLRLNEKDQVNEAELAVLERSGESFRIEAMEEVRLLLLGGKPIVEPVVGYGPFVMNTHAEIQQALLDYRHGKMGRLSAR